MFDKNMHRFLKILHHLYAEQGIGLTDSLEIIGKMKKRKKVSKAALYLEEELKRGNPFLMH